MSGFFDVVVSRACQECEREFKAGEDGWWVYRAPGRKPLYYCPNHAAHRPYVDVAEVGR